MESLTPFMEVVNNKMDTFNASKYYDKEVTRMEMCILPQFNVLNKTSIN